MRPPEQPPPRPQPRTTHALRNDAFAQKSGAFSSAVRQHLAMEDRAWGAAGQMDLDCLGPQGYAELERARAATQPASSWPRHGRRYAPCSAKAVPPRTAATFTAWTTPAPAARRRGRGAFGNDGVLPSKGGQAPLMGGCPGADLPPHPGTANPHPSSRSMRWLSAVSAINS